MKYTDWQYAGKAIGAGIAAGIGSLLLVLTGNETLADVSTVEWLFVAGNILGVYGVTYNAPAQPGPYNK